MPPSHSAGRVNGYRGRRRQNGGTGDPADDQHKRPATQKPNPIPRFLLQFTMAAACGPHQVARKFHTAQAAHPHAHARVARTRARTPGSLSIGLVAWGLRILTSGPSRAFALPGGTGCLWRGSRHGLTTWSTHESFSCHVAKITWPRSRGHGSHRHHRTVAALPRSTARLQSRPVRRQVGE